MRIETIVFEDHGGPTQQAYKAKIRSLHANLKDKKNPSLREGVVSGDIKIDKISRMTAAVISLVTLVLFTFSFDD